MVMKLISMFINEQSRSYPVFYHGSPSGDLSKAPYGIHIGSREAAKEALEARIGVRADGKDWDGSSEYGKTLLAGLKNKHQIYTGFNTEDDIPKENFYATQIKSRAKYTNGTPIPFNVKPVIYKVEIIGPMTNTMNSAMSDEKANSIMRRQIKMGNAKKGYFYKNISEDEGSVSAVVPNAKHLKIIGKV